MAGEGGVRRKRHRNRGPVDQRGSYRAVDALVNETPKEYLVANRPFENSHHLRFQEQASSLRHCSNG
jgi:hypothetical protein